ncbi:hypothetical protein RRG08_003190 [Elysia crispata]|uniref:ZSWIM1/3 RNaseH-like domain-containing protein n=1 Tax=Elysia crispata TaxID=231223 RepID=A0AAE1B8E5_9GAST|nr:hypothetical protein RRG08_003190 [Elysia crispata]
MAAECDQQDVFPSQYFDSFEDFKSLLITIKLRADKNLNKLQGVSANLQHNHVIPAKKDGVYAVDHKLNTKEREDVKKLIDLGAPVRKIQNYISTSYDKQVKTKDLHNLRQRADHQNKRVEEQVWEVLESMVAKDPGAHFSIFSESGKISVLFFQTAYMKKMLNSYPDVLYIDNTYCLNLYGYPVVVFMIVDGDNVGHCVGYACVRDEKMMTLSVLFGEFVRKNEGVKVKTVVVDKDASEIGAVRQTMPECNVVLCRFHVAKTLMEVSRNIVEEGSKRSPLANVPQQYLKERLLRCFEGEEESDGGVVSAEIDVIRASRERSEWEKRMTLKEACRELVAVGVRCGQLVFEKRMRTVRKLIAMWREDKDVEIEDVLEFADDTVEMERNVQFQKRVGRGVGVDDVVEETEEEGGINFEAEVISQEGITVGEEDLIDEVGGDNKIGDVLVCPEMERGIVRVEKCLKRWRQLVEMMLELG